MKNIAAFEYMIKRKIYNYHCDPWYTEPGPTHYESVATIQGQISYKNEIFVVCQESGHSGHGGMDEGSPPSVTIVRVKGVKK